jgi:hypothetical protein
VVACLDSEGAQANFQSIGAIGDCNNMVCASAGREFRFKGLDFRPQNVPTTFQNTIECCCKILCQWAEMSMQIIDWEHEVEDLARRGRKDSVLMNGNNRMWGLISRQTGAPELPEEF